MNTANVRVAISGVTGRMGRQLIRSLLLTPNLCESVVLTAAITKNNSQFVGCDVGKLIGAQSVGIIVHDSIEDICEDFDVLVDFSSSRATLHYLKLCKIYNKNIVIGTTGFTNDELSLIKEVSENIGIVLSPNFSIMVNLMFKLLEKATSILGDCSDIQIIELHHRNKKDIPSGTALMIRQTISSVLSSVHHKQVQDVFSKIDHSYNIDIHSIRAGGLVGKHDVLFVNGGESLEISHQAFNRSIFASGALRSAAWLGLFKIGLFNMLDVLGLNKI